MKNNSFKILFLAIIALLVIFLVTFLLTKFNNPRPKTNFPQTIIPSLTSSPTQTRQKTYVNYVFDGDTVEIDKKITVRLLGIDAPETSNKYTRFQSECFATESAKISKELLMGQSIEMESDVEDKDKYGRLLRYVYLDDIFINEFLLRQGFARLETIPPDTKYAALFAQAEKEARENKRGLWGKCAKVK